MATTTDLVTNFGDVIELQDPNFNLAQMKQVLSESEHWKHYNPRKPEIKRFGLSVTSANGGYSGIPDLDSLREFNMLNLTKFTEKDFSRRTPIANELTGLSEFLDIWSPALGRTHFLKLDKGGFFPPHRDNGLTLPASVARIIVPINWNHRTSVWIQDGKILDLREGKAYFVNTSKEHSLFSFADDTILLVLNVVATSELIFKIIANAKVL
jgi:hypothetical protein